MLNTQPSSVPPAPGRAGIKPPSAVSAARVSEALPRRRRGGQPSNRNALKHGLYAAEKAPLFTRISSSMEHSRKLVDKSPGALGEAIWNFQDITGMLMKILKVTRDPRSFLRWSKLLIKIIKSKARYRRALYKKTLPLRNLYFASNAALGIIRLNIDDIGISRDADSFREKLEESDFNSPSFQEPFLTLLYDPPYPFITPRQWRVLEPLLPPPQAGGASLADRRSPQQKSFDASFCVESPVAAIPSRRRGRPSADPRELLDAAFWKLAHHARWQDLPDYYPPMLTCRRYYRRLFLSGRLVTLYSALYQDLLTRGKADLPAFVEQGCFSITGNQVTLRSDLDENWRMRTALLFLQLGYQAVRRVTRECKLARRQGSTSCRILLSSPIFNPSLVKDPGS